MPAAPTLAGANLLVTGGAGAFGRAFVQGALRQGASRVVVFSRDEAKQAALRATVRDTRVRWFVGDVRDFDRVRWAMRGCDTVVHAAAMKRVDASEENPQEAVDTNITGSSNVARAAVKEGVRRAVLLSTDKAAAPSTLYGVTKSCAERLWIQSNAYAAGTSTRLSVTRYGNVLGSTGSVIPRWEDEAARTGKITLTDPNATRFWMTMGAATRLVTHALADMTGGETFVPALRAASVDTLAYALHPGLPRVVIGLQSGEKLHETLIAEDEGARVVRRGDHYVILPAHQSWGVLSARGVAVPAGFALRSDTAPEWSAAQLRAVCGGGVQEAA